MPVEIERDQIADFRELYSEGRVSIGTTGAVLGEFSAPRTYGLRLSARLGGLE